MDKNSRTCPACKTENQENYIFCKNCGHPLDETQPTGGYRYSPPYGNPFSQPFGFAGPGYSQHTPEINGVKTEKLEAYVGIAKRNYYIPKFIVFSKTGSKTAWNWAILLLGFLLEPVFAASWFFYRKMTKIGYMICAASVVFTAIFMLFSFNDVYNTFRQIFLAIETTSLANLEEFANQPVNEIASFYQEIIDLAKTAILAAGVISLALFGNYLYMKRAVLDIKNFDKDGVYKSHEMYELIGKPKTAQAILIPLLFAFINLTISSIPILMAMAEIYS